MWFDPAPCDYLSHLYWSVLVYCSWPLNREGMCTWPISCVCLHFDIYRFLRYRRWIAFTTYRNCFISGILTLLENLDISFKFISWFSVINIFFCKHYITCICLHCVLIVIEFHSLYFIHCRLSYCTVWLLSERGPVLTSLSSTDRLWDMVQ